MRLRVLFLVPLALAVMFGCSGASPGALGLGGSGSSDAAPASDSATASDSGTAMPDGAQPSDGGADASTQGDAADGSPASDSGLGGCSPACGIGEKCVGGACTCDPSTCTGCCEGTACKSGADPGACGHAGAVCVACASGCVGGTCGACVPQCAGAACGDSDGCGGSCMTGSCTAGLHCAGGSCICDDTSCTGCCAGAQCLAGTSSTACGSAGSACSACSAPNTCGGGGVTGGCGCTPNCSGKACGESDGCGGICEGTCGSGQHCVSGACVCDATSCASGCCAGATCTTGDTGPACGAGGAACSTCAATQSCALGSCIDAVLLAPVSGGFSSGGHALAIDPAGEYLYFIDQNNSPSNMLIGRVPTSGGAEEVIASGLNWPVSIAVDSTNLYWTSINDNTVVAQSLSSGARQTLATEQYFPIDIAVLDSQTVYWSACTTSAGTLCDFWSLPVGGGSPTSLYSFTTGGNPVLSVLSPNLYAAVPGQAILSFAIAPGGTSATLDTGSYWDVTAGQGWVAWYSAETSQGASNGLLKTGSVGSSIVVASGNPEAIAVDGNNVYWANANDGNVFLGTLATVPVLGGSPSVLVAGVSTFHMVVDESNVYWLGFDATTSGVFRTAK